MITDQATIAEIKQGWSAVKTLQNPDRSFLIPGGGYFNERTADGFYNLPLVLAYGMLETFLAQCEVEKFITLPPRKGRFSLGELLGASDPTTNSNFKWTDFASLTKGKDIRNDVAHRAKLASKQDCFKYINLIEAELQPMEVI
jgi:hypothetical protein